MLGKPVDFEIYMGGLDLHLDGEAEGPSGGNALPIP